MAKTGEDRPQKPYPDFPLFPSKNGQWCKKIRGKLSYFGSWRLDSTGENALKDYLSKKDYLQAGLTPPRPGAVTLKELCNTFLHSYRTRVDDGLISPRTFSENRITCKQLLASINGHRAVEGLTPEDFAELHRELRKKLGPTRLGNTVQRIRSLFKYAYDNSLIDKPVRFGSEFKRPSKKQVREVRNARGVRMLEREDLLRVLSLCDPQLKAMTLLGIQAGFGQTDVSELPKDAIDFQSGWINYPRPKTGVIRQVPLWPETIEALQAVLDKPRKPAKSVGGDDLVFLTKYGHPWTRTQEPRPNEFVQVDSVSLQFRKILKELDIHKSGLNFYALRHGFETIGAESRDDAAVSAIMGHVDDSMAGRYRERFPKDRLEDVVNYIRNWLLQGKTLEDAIASVVESVDESKLKPKQATKPKAIPAPKPTRPEIPSYV